MYYWIFRERKNIKSFEDLNKWKNKISNKNYEYIYNMIEWEFMDYQERIDYLKYYSIYNIDKNEFLFFNLNTKKINNQLKLKIIHFGKEFPFVIDWILQNWNFIIKDLNLNYTCQNLFVFLVKNIKIINYNFKFKYSDSKILLSTDQWNIGSLSEDEIMLFISKGKEIGGYISIYYLFNKKATLSNISKNWKLGITRERVRQINLKEIQKNNVFFVKIYEFIKNRIILIDDINVSALKVIEKILYPEVKDQDSILNLDEQILLKLQEKLENSSFLDFRIEELKILIKNNRIIFYKKRIYKIEKKFWKIKVLNFKNLLIIFLKINYRNTQIIIKEKLREEFYEFLLENNKLNKNYNFSNSRAFDSLVSRTQELIYYDNKKIVINFEQSILDSEIADKILNEFIKIEKKQIIMVSTKKYLELFNYLTNYKYLNPTPNFIHNYLRKYCTINNKNNYFSTAPILINSIANINIIDLFYKQVKILFNDNKIIDWDLFLDVIKNECGLDKIIIQNYVSASYKYLRKNKNNLIILN